MTTPIHRLALSANRCVELARQRLERYFVVRLLARTVKEMSDDDATHMAASVSYYTLFSLFPLLLGLIALLSLFIESQDLQTRLTDFTTDYLPGSEEFVSTNVDAVLRLRGALGIAAILGLLWSSSAVFGAVTRTINRAWDVHKDRPLYISKPRQLAMALGVGVLFWLSLSAATVVRLADQFVDSDVAGVGFLVNVGGRVVLQGFSFLLMVSVFLLLYKFLPNTKTYWPYIWPGAVVAAVLFEVAKGLFITYLNRFASFENVYGTLAPVMVLLLWSYVSALILTMGAELSSEYGRLREGVGRGVLLRGRGQSPGSQAG